MKVESTEQVKVTTVFEVVREGLEEKKEEKPKKGK